MAIPLFVPSPKLLVSWHFKHNILYERTWNGVNGGRARSRSPVPRHDKAGPDILVEDPNNEIDEKAMLKWIQYADFYQMPHVMQFESFDHLISQLSRFTVATNAIEATKNEISLFGNENLHMNLSDISRLMAKYVQCRLSINLVFSLKTIHIFILDILLFFMCFLLLVSL